LVNRLFSTWLVASYLNCCYCQSHPLFIWWSRPMPEVAGRQNFFCCRFLRQEQVRYKLRAEKRVCYTRLGRSTVINPTTCIHPNWALASYMYLRNHFGSATAWTPSACQSKMFSKVTFLNPAHTSVFHSDTHLFSHWECVSSPFPIDLDYGLLCAMLH